ncbi:transposase [Aliiglaciecola sp. LCG003]|uniref:transposase n=1 Tax=Aliiglaciecola sp. LCG003 TaxID=3053655 RepID=UPI00257395A6|nr:transposase [Aliiglaciecola sp. LCG003]WJG07834.1 transposase [Aliiglaciecola sp. LCG003]WJG10816.1 transposase [Aliiglaciecola sp. LCG003]
MPQARKNQISLIDTPYYHCVSRCVRRSFLCGEDKYTGQSYEHRRDWVESRLLFLGSVFAIDIAAYAVMSNHTHVVLCVDKDLAGSWPDKEVLSRWHRLHKGTLLTQKYLRGDALSTCEQLTVDETVEVVRHRLYDISWFMRELNEHIAREANAEDGCTGRFWEGRFKSQALLDESAVLACMAYVDLNPIRSKMESTPETSKHTSVFQRIHALKEGKQPASLMCFVGNYRQNMPKGIAFSLIDYCVLVDSTGRSLRDDKAGYIDHSQSDILQRLNINTEQWLALTTEFEKHFATAVGSEHMLQQFKRHTKHQRIRGMGKAKILFKHA